MNKDYPYRVNIEALCRYSTQALLQSQLENLFETLAKPWNKNYGFSTWGSANWPSAVLFNNAEDADMYVKFLNETYKVENFLFIDEPFEVTTQSESA